MTTFLAFSGSSRKGSFNQMTLNCVTNVIEGDVTHIRLKDLNLPIYDGDDEAATGLPAGVKELKAKLNEHDGLIIGCPEYNGFMSPLLINAIDWSTRSETAVPDLSCFADKPVLIVSASPGGLAGMRASTHLRTMLSGIGCFVIPDHFGVPSAFKAFGDDGELVDEKMQGRAKQVADRFTSFTQQLLN